MRPFIMFALVIVGMFAGNFHQGFIAQAEAVRRQELVNKPRPTQPVGPEPIDVPVVKITPKVVKREGVGIGVMQPGSPWDDCEGYKTFAAETGADLAYVHWFQTFGDSDSMSFRTEWVKCAAEMGATPLISWEPWARQLGQQVVDPQPRYSMTAIADGKLDWYLSAWAREAKATKVDIYVRFAHEMDTEDRMHHWYPWQGSPREFVRAWRHVVDVFRAEGATNVKWVWAPIDPDKSFSRAYYPGSGYVDAVSTTVINFGELEYQDWMQWHSFESLFDKKYTALSRYGKPIILSETETNEGKPGQKAQWITDMFKAIAKGKYPKLTALIWFNVESDHMYPSINWSLSSSESATQAFREGVQLLKDMPAPKPTPSSSVHNSQPN